MSGRSSSGAVGKLGRHETLYDFRLAEQLDTAKHFFTYDRSSIHRPPQTPSNTSTPASDAVTTVAKDPEPTRQQIPVRNPTQQRLRKRIEDKFADLPPLQEEEDDEDTEDRQAVARYSKESNNWLLFAGVFALLTTIFITSFTLLPHQIASRQANLEMLANLARYSEFLHASPEIDTSEDPFAQAVLSFNLTSYLEPPPPPTLAMTIRDEWVSGLWYTSLMFTLMGTMLTLTIKHWLMSCTFHAWPSIFDMEPIDTVADAERYLARRPNAQKKAELRKRRKEALRKTAMLRNIIPWFMYPAMVMFAAGIFAKIGSSMWIVWGAYFR